jgi:hypothetical protein
VNLEEFWALVEGSGRQRPDAEARAEWLARELARRPRADIEQFQVHLDALRERADTWHLWGAAWLLCGGLCPGDAFWYFLAWLIGQGREAFETVAADPDALADLPAVRRLAGRDAEDWSEHEWPDWESLDHTAEEAYETATDDDLITALAARGHVFRSSPSPTGERWDFDDTAELERRYPRLSRLFPATTS